MPVREINIWEDRIQVWREKAAISIIFLLLSSLFIFLTEGLPRLLCSNQPITSEKLKASNLVLIHGEVIDLSNSNSALGNFSKMYPGKDISSAVPLFDLLARFSKSKIYPYAPINACVNSVQTADNWLRNALKTQGYEIRDRAMESCPNPDPSSPDKYVPCFFRKEDHDEIRRNKVADYAYTEEELSRVDPGELLRISAQVFDLKSFLDPQLYANRSLIPTSLLFPEDITTRIIGVSSTSEAHALMEAPDWDVYQRCLRLLFYRGKVSEPAALGLQPECVPWVVALVAATVPLGLLFLKLFLSFIPARNLTAAHTGHFPCILFVPCFNETREELAQCIGSGAGSEPKSYQSVGEGNKAINSAQVYSGYFYHGAHGVPYVVIVKVGNVNEVGLAGNRGKRDSLLILLNFLDGVSSPENLLTPLEAEMSECILGLELVPSTFNYLFCVDADTRVDPDSLPQMLHYLDSRPDCLAVSGQLRFNAGGHWLLDPLQRFRACFSRHQATCAMATLNTLTHLNGGFVVYRLQQSTGTRCLTHEEVVFQLSSKRIGTLHTKHLLLLGEEQYVTTLLLKYWPGLRLGYVPAALAKTSGYASLRQLVLKERLALCTRFHNRLDLWTSSVIWGNSWATFMWMSLAILWSFLMPVAMGLLYLHLIRAIIVGTLPFLLPAFLAAACLFLALVFCVLNYYPGLLGGLLLYVVVGIPLYHVVIPIFSFFTMDNFSWYDLGGDQTRARPHGAMEEVLGKPIASVYRRSTRPLEKTYNHLSYRSAYLPVPGGFQSLYTELNRMGLPINMPSGEASPGAPLRGDTVPMAVLPRHSTFTIDFSSGKGPQSGAPQPFSLQALRISFPAHSPLGLRHIPGLRDSIVLNTSRSHSRAQTYRSDPLDTPSVLTTRPTRGFPLPPTGTPEMSQAGSTSVSNPVSSRFSMQVSELSRGMELNDSAQPNFAGFHSDYNSKFSLSVASSAQNDLYLEDVVSMPSSIPSHRFSSNLTITSGLPTDSTPHGPDDHEAILQSKALIREEIDHFLQGADLNAVTHREIRDHLLAVFDDHIFFYQDFILQYIQEYTLKRMDG
ncbi:hypothetical protein L0F63_001576 [Massospora cicadina]|nr:hypothetical protein L0F63_001576 [Massospora cicadina]